MEDPMLAGLPELPAAGTSFDLVLTSPLTAHLIGAALLLLLAHVAIDSFYPTRGPRR